MKVLSRIAGISILVGMLAGCQTMGGGNQTGGTLLGAAAGGLVGAQFGSGKGQIAMAVLGALAGSQIGAHIGRTMDAQDAQRMSGTLEHAPSGHQQQWVNPDSGYQHVVVPHRPVIQNNGQPCREFTHTVYIGGKAQEAYGTACRQADGSWKITQ